MICNTCFLRPGCERKVDEDGRCRFYVKEGQIEFDDDVDVNPLDTLTFDYDDMKRHMHRPSAEVSKKKRTKKRFKL